MVTDEASEHSCAGGSCSNSLSGCVIRMDVLEFTRLRTEGKGVSRLIFGVLGPLCTLPCSVSAGSAAVLSLLPSSFCAISSLRHMVNLMGQTWATRETLSSPFCAGLNNSRGFTC
ncbi:unnamed protein product [Discosporangium mesarthrocarpum]